MVVRGGPEEWGEWGGNGGKLKSSGTRRWHYQGIERRERGAVPYWQAGVLGRGVREEKVVRM